MANAIEGILVIKNLQLLFHLTLECEQFVKLALTS